MIVFGGALDEEHDVAGEASSEGLCGRSQKRPGQNFSSSACVCLLVRIISSVHGTRGSVTALVSAFEVVLTIQ
eukprot:scaffold2353_cov167-Amphora_coffeaeformis.AAC.34